MLHLLLRWGGGGQGQLVSTNDSDEVKHLVSPAMLTMKGCLMSDQSLQKVFRPKNHDVQYIY